MFYGTTAQDTRALFFSSWQKYCNKLPLTPLEGQIATVISEHPEYHGLLGVSGAENGKAYFPELGETNPFLHMGLHLAIRDQLATNRPEGIRTLYDQYLQQSASPLETEHRIMEQLAECLWNAQRNQTFFSEEDYLAGLTRQLEL